MTEYKTQSTCQRRGYELTDIHIWQVTSGTPAKHLYYWNSQTKEQCEPPEYIDLGMGEHPRILPPDATIVGVGATKKKKKVAKENKMNYNGELNVESIITSLQSLVDERDALLQRVEELENEPKGPDVELVDQWRIQFRWYGSGNELEQEWGFSSQQEAEERFQVWVSTFGDKFKDVEIIHYMINKESV